MAARVPTLEDLPPLEGKRVLLRADFNVPLRDGEIDFQGRYYTARCRVDTTLGERLDLSLRFYCDDN